LLLALLGEGKLVLSPDRTEWGLAQIRLNWHRLPYSLRIKEVHSCVTKVRPGTSNGCSGTWAMSSIKLCPRAPTYGARRSISRRLTLVARNTC